MAAKDFFVDTKSHCFICMKKISNYDNTESSASSSTFYSLQLLSHFLKIDKKKVFNEKMPVPPHLLKLVEKSQLKVELCGACASTNDKFSATFKQFERITMELFEVLREIQQKMTWAEQHGLSKKFRNSVEETSLDSEKVNIVERVRKETVLKCTKKINSCPPRVRIQRKIDVKNSNTLETNSLLSTFHKTLSRSRVGRPPKFPNSPLFLSYYRRRKAGLIKKPSYHPNTDKFSTALKDNATIIKGMFGCNHCSKNFASQTLFKSHFEGVHLNLRQYSCDLCPLKFNFSSNLRVHKNKTHFGKVSTFKCFGCKNDYQSHYLLRKHMMKCDAIPLSKRTTPRPRGRPPGTSGRKTQPSNPSFTTTLSNSINIPSEDNYLEMESHAVVEKKINGNILRRHSDKVLMQNGSHSYGQPLYPQNEPFDNGEIVFVETMEIGLDPDNFLSPTFDEVEESESL